MEFDSGPNPIDRHVGLRIRIRRKQLRITQEELADTIGLTFQQVQKYERAANRVSASKLWEVAQALNTTVGYFYEGMEPGLLDGLDRDSNSVAEFLLTNDGLQLAECFPRIAADGVRRELLELIRALAEDPETSAG